MTVAPEPVTPGTAVTTSGNIGKEIASAFYTTAMAVVVALTDKGISPVEWITIVGTLLLNGIGIYAAKNTRFKYGKAISGALTAAIGTLCTALFDGNITAEEVGAIIAAVAGSLGLTGAVSNAPYSTDSRSRYSRAA